MRRGLGLGLLLLGCESVDGPVFVETTDPVDLACDIHIGERIEGNDSRFRQECGEPCDSDWCGCEPCEMEAAPFARLSAGQHELRIQGGASGEGTFALSVTLADGAVLLEDVRTYEGLFEDLFVFTVPEDCAVVHVSLALQNEVCSRIYEFQLDPPPM